METKLEATTIHSREGSNKYVHTVLGGELVITFVEQNADDVSPRPPGGTPIDTSDNVGHSRFRANITFECDGTGELFDGSYTLVDLSKLVSILALEDEVRDLFTEKPRMIISDTSVCICYEVHGQKKKYPIALKLTPRKYSSENADIVRLQTENRVLKKRLEKLEDRMNDRLDELTSAIGAIKDLLIVRVGGDTNMHRFLQPLLIHGSRKFLRSWDALIAKPDGLMWDNLIAHRYADGMENGWGEHILVYSLSGHSLSGYPMIIDRLMSLMNAMSSKDIRSKDGKSIIQMIDALISRRESSDADRAEWKRLRDHAVARGFQ